MNPIQAAIGNVKYSIPEQILLEAFVRSEYNNRALPVTVDAMIRQRVIDARVRTDCNLQGGQQVDVPLAALAGQTMGLGEVVYRIPKSMTRGQSISRVIRLNFGRGYIASAGYSNATGAAVGDAASGMTTALTGVPQVSTAYISMIAENTVLVTNFSGVLADATLTCYIEYDSDFSHMRSTTQQHFNQLVLLAVKAYVYNKLIIQMGQNQLSGGMELGQFRNIVEGYADANEMYQNYIREVWMKVMVMDDTKSREHHLRMLVARQ